eukprot:symbB.v1.2.011514.t1/scaffold777.1/size163462/5
MNGRCRRKPRVVVLGWSFMTVFLSHAWPECLAVPSRFQELSIQHADAEETEDKLMELWERRNLWTKGNGNGANF